jgi:hypothetical protein
MPPFCQARLRSSSGHVLPGRQAGVATPSENRLPDTRCDPQTGRLTIVR